MVEGDSQDARHRVEVFGPFGKARCIGPAVTGDLVPASRRIAPESQGLPAPDERRRHRGGMHPLQPVRVQPQFGHDLTPEQPRVLCGHVDAAPREDFLGGRHTPHHPPPLHHQHLPPLSRKQGGRDQPIVARAHDHRVVHLHRADPAFPFPRPKSPITTPAASLPGAPMIPPPGCVPDPHW